mmetsp:Transcript_84030/g.186548  ORF Transcript_84030/g.186548 Transcript_84030/m.186548 type:complete len:262 (-) Transcript_84030:57-842(-)
MACEEHVQDTADGKNVRLLVIGLVPEDLRCHETIRAYSPCEKAALTAISRDTEVGELDDAAPLLRGHRRRAEEVARLQVPMHDASRVQVPHAVDHLLQHLECLLLRHLQGAVLVAIRCQVLPKITTFANLRHQVVLIFIFEGLEEAQDVGMVSSLVDLDLVLQHLCICYVRLRDYLHCDLLACAYIHSTVNRSSSPSAQLSAHRILSPQCRGSPALWHKIGALEATPASSELLKVSSLVVITTLVHRCHISLARIEPPWGG